MEAAVGWIVIGIFLGAGLTLALVVLGDEVRLAPPADTAALPATFRQAWRT